MRHNHQSFGSLALAVALFLSGCQPVTQTEVAPAPSPAPAAQAHQHEGMAPAPPAGLAPAMAHDTGAMHRMDPDTRFMHHMTAHHAQALAMVALVPARTSAQGLRLLAERIDISQKDEIALMRRWLERRGKPLPADDEHAMHMSMPGMLSEADIARLAAATGVEFERLFLELMIRHHEGALTMVRELLGSQGAAQDSEMYRLVADVEADQRGEIARMRSMLNALGTRPPG